VIKIGKSKIERKKKNLNNWIRRREPEKKKEKKKKITRRSLPACPGKSLDRRNQLLFACLVAK